MKKSNSQFIKFLLAGGTAAIANFSSRFLFGLYMQYVPSIILAYIVGIITAYLICRLFVFDASENSTIQQISYFVLVNVFAIIQTIIVSLLFADYFLIKLSSLSLRESIAHLIGISVPIFTSYFGHKYLSFK